MDKEEISSFITRVEQLDNYIKSIGAQPIGPIIQKTTTAIDDEGNPVISINLLRQANKYIVHPEAPYNSKSIIRVKNCMYVRYIGPETKINLAIDKINVIAFEENIRLSNEIYTVVLSENEDDSMVDVFIEEKGIPCE
jgi:hypothetical protein